VPHPVTSLFGQRDGRPHEGIDLGSPDGSPVRAVCGGRVVYAAERLRGYGRMVVLDHGRGLTTVYAHNEQLLVEEGQRVEAGQLLARSGHTGRATAPHLHFEVRRGGRPEDPLQFLPKRPGALVTSSLRPAESP
jgi:lipoprotein NlpD